MSTDAFFVLAAYGAEHREPALELVQEMAARLLPKAQLRGVVVDNRLPGQLEIELDAITTCISGDNTAREFSAWDRGLSWLNRTYALASDSVLILSNDTLHRSYGRAYVDGFTTLRLAEALSSDGILGWMDAYPREVALFGRSLRCWVRTSLMVACVGVIERLRPFALPFSDHEIFSSDIRELFRVPSPLSDNYRRYLRTWLFGESGDAEFAERWHSAESLSSLNAAAFRAKIRSILCEHHFSARAQAMGFPLIDVR